LGYANAWTPLVDAVENSLWVLPISKKIISWDMDDYFLLKVEGTSMNEFKVKWKKIENWSYVLINRKDTNLNNKDAFLFLVDWAATIKKFKKDWDIIYLLPESRDDYHKPIILSTDDNIIVNWKVVDVFTF